MERVCCASCEKCRESVYTGRLITCPAGREKMQQPSSIANNLDDLMSSSRECSALRVGCLDSKAGRQAIVDSIGMTTNIAPGQGCRFAKLLKA